MAEIVAGMGEIVFGGEGDTLMAQGLGSCIGLLLFDKGRKLAGLAHVMLADSSINRAPPVPRSVLLAEHDSKVRAKLKDILLTHQFEVIGEAEEREKTLELYRRNRPGISLVSTFLPPDHGLGTVDALLTLDRNANVLLLSPSTGSKETLTLLQRGARGLIATPFTEEKVVHIAEEALRVKLYKYADVAFSMLQDTLRALGAKEFEAVIVGGAYMFPQLEGEGLFNIGQKNIDVIKGLLRAAGITIVAEEIGGSIGRTFWFEVGAGKAMIRTKDGEKCL